MNKAARVVAPGRGRTRDPQIEINALAAARRHLAAHGFEAMSLTAIAEEAGTTRQALYRRWPNKSDLVAAAMTSIPRPEPAAALLRSSGKAAGHPFVDLVAEMTDFQRGISRPGRMSLVGAMLQDGTDADVLGRYRARIVAPRRQRLRSILQRARDEALIDADADLEVAVTMCTGAWYARALAGGRPPAHWPRRTAALVWRAVGGVPPPGFVTRRSQL